MLRTYVRDNKKEFLNMDTDLSADKFLILSVDLNELKHRLECNSTNTLGNIVPIRLGGFTGCDSGFLLSEEQGEYLLSLEKYTNLIVPCRRPRSLYYPVKEYLIHMTQGFTNSALEKRKCTLDEFKVIYKELFDHFELLDNATMSRVLSRQEHFKGDYWWELSRGQCNYENYKKEGYIIPRISKKFELIDFDGSFMPLNGFSYICGKLPKDIEDYLRSDDFTVLFNNFYSTDVKQGGYYTRNVNIIKTIKI